MEIKELKDVLAAVEKLTIDLIDDGVQLSDFLDNVAPIFTAIEGATAIPAEVKDLKRDEIKELGVWAFDFVFKILDALESKSE